MLDTLKLVRGAVAVKDLVPVLTYFHIYNGRIQGGNGRVTIDAPLPQLTMNLTVPAARFLKAVDGCGGEPNLTVTEAGALMVKKGAFRVRLPLTKPEEFPVVEPSQDLDRAQPITNLLPLLRRLRPFIGEDASRPWLCSVAFRDGYAYATNNPVMVRVPAPGVPDMVLPVFAVDELLRIGQEPDTVVVLETALQFWVPGGVWLQCQTLEGEWPEVERFFADRETPAPVPAGLADAVTRVVPFCPDQKFPEVHLGTHGVSTADGDMQAAVEGLELPESRWHSTNLLLVLSEATHVDFAAWPGPCYWEGPNGAKGVAVGLSK